MRSMRMYRNEVQDVRPGMKMRGMDVRPGMEMRGVEWQEEFPRAGGFAQEECVSDAQRCLEWRCSMRRAESADLNSLV